MKGIIVMTNQIYVVVKRTTTNDTEIAYRETWIAAMKEAEARRSYDPNNSYIVVPKKVFSLYPDND